jgi:hypothetical protein
MRSSDGSQPSYTTGIKRQPLLNGVASVLPAAIVVGNVAIPSAVLAHIHVAEFVEQLSINGDIHDK